MLLPPEFVARRDALVRTFSDQLAPFYSDCCDREGHFHDSFYSVFQEVTASRLRQLEADIAKLKRECGIGW